MFFMKKESDQQGLDINIGRVLEMFRTSVLDPAQTAESLTRFFTGEGQKDIPALQAYLTRVLTAVDDGTIDLSRARACLVDAAGASERHEPNFADRLKTLCEPPVAAK
ncbi:hypothetical protein [Asticcacaulis sp. EMRT-3]|uniref:hypothetical protein n=1 Tax=Asticcacaulis sp. EMRT-3 TaxID=3040349 RepID=UPI0024AFE8DB|nr:hypothetical protein [Asticcacaulis sp. EMRT-3]MDI7775539.1 hypothetical protein [Asticcacaulis sp. EMRT-3]